MYLDIWALWPDGYMCPKEEIYQFTTRSDDYELVNVLEYDETFEPAKWEKYDPAKAREYSTS